MAGRKRGTEQDSGYLPVRTSGAYEAVVRQLEEQVTSGRLQPGARLPSIAELSRTLRVSIPVVREAVMSLRARGLLDVRHGSGTYVAEPPDPKAGLPSALPPPVDAAGLLHLLEVRLPLEVRAAELAAARKDSRPLTDLEASVAAMARAGQEHDGPGFLAADKAFHLGLALLSGNPYLPTILEPILDLFARPGPGAQGNGGASGLPTGATAMLHHRAIVAALRDGNVEMAALVMREHLNAHVRGLKAKAPV